MLLAVTHWACNSGCQCGNKTSCQFFRNWRWTWQTTKLNKYSMLFFMIQTFSIKNAQQKFNLYKRCCPFSILGSLSLVIAKVQHLLNSGCAMEVGSIKNCFYVSCMWHPCGLVSLWVMPKWILFRVRKKQWSFQNSFGSSVRFEDLIGMRHRFGCSFLRVFWPQRQKHLYDFTGNAWQISCPSKLSSCTTTVRQKMIKSKKTGFIYIIHLGLLGMALQAMKGLEWVQWGIPKVGGLCLEEV